MVMARFVLRCLLGHAATVLVAQTVSSISPGSVNVTGAGGTGTVVITAAANASWTAVSANSWIRVSSPLSGSGNASLFYSVYPNPAQSARMGSINVGGQTFTVNQSAGDPPFAITWAPVGPHDIGAPD